MTIQCTKCNRDAIILQKYSGLHLCRKHFVMDVEHKVKLTIRKQYNIEKNDIIAVALSGGKDSTVLLYLLHKIFSKRNDITIVAISIDEGIDGYRAETLKQATQLTSRLGVKHIVCSFNEAFGKTLDELVAQKRELGACSYCGVLRKSLLNKIANKIGANKLATGHNLDDEAQTIMMNYLGGDVKRIIRLSPQREIKGLVLRSKPLRKIPEKEVALYAIVKKLPLDMHSCPYAHEALRGEVRDMLNSFESKHPGTKYSIMQGFDKMVGILAKEFPHSQLGQCRICGETCNDELCRACKLLNRGN